MPLSAWIMLSFAILVLYGGFILCVIIANRKKKEKAEDVA